MVLAVVRGQPEGGKGRAQGCAGPTLGQHCSPGSLLAPLLAANVKQSLPRLLPLQEASKAALRAKGGSELRGRKLRMTVAKKPAKADGKGAAWQQGKGSSGKGGGGKGSKPVASKRAAGGKRPAVAARKAAAKLSAKGGVQKKRKGD